MEGPSVHHLADKLKFFEGQRINFADGNAKEPIELLESKTIDSVRAVKKRLFFDADNVHAVIHFLMFGSYRVNQKREGMEPRLVLDCSEDVFISYNSSVNILEDGNDDLDYYDRPEEDILSEEFNVKRTIETMRNYEGPLIDILLDQDVFGGVGNIIKNEVLFRTGHFPELETGQLSESECQEIIEEVFEFSEHWMDTKKNDDPLGMKIYQKNICPHCGDDVKKEEMGKNQRVTYWCPTCQCK